jgi:hypothetical protein
MKAANAAVVSQGWVHGGYVHTADAKDVPSALQLLLHSSSTAKIEPLIFSLSAAADAATYSCNTADADLENTLESAAAAVPAASADGAVVEVCLEAPGQDKAKLPPPPILVSTAAVCLGHFCVLALPLGMLAVAAARKPSWLARLAAAQ